MLIGIVGVPNSGKSTFLKAATLSDVEIANYPFTTIKANRGVGYITAKCPCSELGKKCNPRNGKCVKGTRFIPINLLDVAGLVPDAHKGKGLGNQFLDDLRESDGLVHVLDVSGRTNSKGETTEGFDPYLNVQVLEKELDYWFADIFKREFGNIKKRIKLEHADFEKHILSRFSGLGIKKKNLEEAIKKSNLDLENVESWTDEDVLKFSRCLREESKPILIAANKIDVPSSSENLRELKEKVFAVPCSTEAELALREASEAGMIDYLPGSNNFEILKPDKLSEKQKKALEFVKRILETYGSTGVQNCLNELVFGILNYIVVYPVEDDIHWSDKRGNILPDAFLVPEGTTAKELAYKVHTDIGEEFIGAIDARTGKKIGADSVLKNNDIIKILT